MTKRTDLRMNTINRLIRYFLPKEKMAEKFREDRKRAYENCELISEQNLVSFQKFHRFVMAVLKLDLLFNHQKRVILKDKSYETNHPIIYACTHIGRWDAEHCLLAINKQAHVFFGDPGGIYRTVNGLLLSINGVIYCDTDNKIDRMAAKASAIGVLNRGGNILIYPEGAWNITENEPVMTLYNGAVDMAVKTGADIIPIAMEFYDRTYVMNIGTNISYNVWDEYNISSETGKLRSVLATLRWEIWENEGLYRRSELSKTEAKEYQDYVMRGADANDYSVEKIQKRRFNKEHKW